MAVARGARLARRNKFTPRVFSELSFHLLNAVESTGAEVEIEGAHKIKSLSGKPCVFAANHVSLLETFLLPSITGAFGPVTVVAKRSLAKYPNFGNVIKATQPILLDRNNARKDLHETLTEGKDRLERGISIILFPQGSRSAVFNPRKFNSLATKLAREAGVPLVPIACKTDFAILGKLIKDLGPVDPSKNVKFAIGAPISPTLSQNEMQAECVSFIKEKLISWGCPCEG